MPSLPSNRTAAKAPVLRTERFARILGVVTLVYWALLPTGLLLPLVIGFDVGVNAIHLGIGLMLLMATSVVMGPRLEPAARLPLWHLGLILVFVAFLALSSVDPINACFRVRRAPKPAPRRASR